jgi:WhiB family transcriptional regulator, redox-sensing transcriptional regulator
VTEWMADALCLEVGADLWYPEPGAEGLKTINLAKKVCGMCPVQAECLAHALATREPHGIWGGVTAKNRRGMTTTVTAKRYKDWHGTSGGYRKHFREGTKPCEPCKRADRVARERRQEIRDALAS